VNRAQRDGSHFALASLDVDRFKQINDALGHPAGDQILRAIAGRLREHCRDGDLLARVGGEEFAVILHGLGIAGALAIAERLRNGVAAQPVRYSIGGTNGQVAVTVSVGEYFPGTWRHAGKNTGGRRPRALRGQERRAQSSGARCHVAGNRCH